MSLQIQTRSIEPIDWKAKYEAEKAKNEKIMDVFGRLIMSLKRLGTGLEPLKGMSESVKNFNPAALMQILPAIKKLEPLIDKEFSEHIGPICEIYVPYFEARAQNALPASPNPEPETSPSDEDPA